MRGRVLTAATLGLLLGCGTAPPPPKATSAKEAAFEFYQAVIAQDWDRAYARLSAPSQSRFSPPTFTARAKDYHRQLGFEPKEVKLSACDEKDQEALAHVVLIGDTKRYKDGLTLHRDETGWKVNLPVNFGQQRR